MLSAEKFLDLLEQKDLVPKEVLQGLRRRVAVSGKPIGAEQIAKHLVQAGHLTPSQAQRLLQQLRQSLGPEAGREASEPQTPSQEPGRPSGKPAPSVSAGPSAGKSPPKAAPPDQAEPPGGLASLLEEELGLAPLEEEKKPSLFGPTVPPAETRPSEPKPAKPGVAPSGPATPPGTKAGAKPPSGEKAASKPAGRPAGPTSKQQPPQGAAKPPAAEPAGAPPPSLASLLEEELGAVAPTSAGPGDLEALLATSAVESAGPLTPLAPVAKRRRFWARWFRREARPRPRGWDSPLILVGSGVLVILVLVGIVLILVLRRESGDALLEAAHADFAQGSYTQAIFKYTEFLERFPRHSGASLARVRRGVAQIRQSVEEARDWPNTLQTAQNILAEIAGEEQFREAHAELSSLLPAIAKGLADLARKQPHDATLQLAHETLALVDRYVPKSLQNQVELDEIRASLAVSARRLHQEAEIEKTVSAIHQAIQAAQPQQGYALARSLVRQYPEAATHEKLAQTLVSLKEAFQKQLQRVETNRPAETEEPASPIQTETPLATPSGQPLAGIPSEVVVSSFGGCVYALDAATGKLLWRRWTGPVSTGRTIEPQPLPVSTEPQSDLIVVGASRQELWRLERTTGRLRWRNRLAGPLQGAPVLGRKHVLAVSELNGRTRLEWIELDTGRAELAVEIPQKVPVSPAVDLRRDRLFVIGEHSYLWILSLQDGQCLELVLLGHEAGAITAPPLPLADWVLTAENHRIDRALLKLLAVGVPGQTATQIVFQEEVPGHVDIPPIVADRRLVVLTDRGAIRVYEIQPSGGKSPLARVAERSPEGPANLVRFPLLVGQQLWVAGEELTRFEVQTALGRLAFQPLAEPDTGDVFLHTPWALEKAVIHTRYRPGVPGVWVAAVDSQTGKRQWQTHLAVPPAGEPIPLPDAPTKLLIVQQTGEVFGVEFAQTGPHASEAPLATLALASVPTSPAQPSKELIGRCVLGPDGMPIFSFGPGTDRWFVLERKEGTFQWITVPAPAPLAQTPTPFAEGVLVPTQSGRIELRHPRTGAELLAPFQPPLEPGRLPVWSMPTVIPSAGPSQAQKEEPAQAKSPPAPEAQQQPAADSEKQVPPDTQKQVSSDTEKSGTQKQVLPDTENRAAVEAEKQDSSEGRPARSNPEFLVSEGDHRVYRVGIAERPKPHLKALATVDLPGRVVSPLAVVGQTVWVVEKHPPADRQKPEEKAEPQAGSPWAEQSPPSPKTQPAKSPGETYRLVCLQLPNLERKEASVLEGRCVWGPACVGDLVFLATDAGQYLLGDGQGNIVADLRTFPDPPAGAPLSWKGGLFVATRKGQILWLRHSADGWKTDCFLDLARPLASGPVVVQKQLVVLAHDGAVYALGLPDVSQETPPQANPKSQPAGPSQESQSDSQTSKPNSQTPKPKSEAFPQESPSAPHETTVPQPTHPEASPPEPKPAPPESTQKSKPTPNHQASFREPVR